ncbi:hypothetical protein [Streptococcus sobrinus]|uniref:hypothetical protein n=1 Tax=Streptococcus sobrinus TaxID=1310 RepID=UPI0002D44CFB|nr:hypothetical protein [Streptococcus sobrinus]
MNTLKTIYEGMKPMAMFSTSYRGNKIVFSSSKIGLYLEGTITLSDTVPHLRIKESNLFEDEIEEFEPDTEELIDFLSGLNDKISDYANAVSNLSTLLSLLS